MRCQKGSLENRLVIVVLQKGPKKLVLQKGQPPPKKGSFLEEGVGQPPKTGSFLEQGAEAAENRKRHGHRGERTTGQMADIDTNTACLAAYFLS